MALNFNNNEELERVFLLELIVDSVYLNNSKIDLQKSVLSLVQKRSVRFHFLDFPTIDINEDDFCGTGNVPFKSGKSCIFSLQHLPQDLQVYQVGVEVFGHKDTPEPILLARTCVDLGELFRTLLCEIESICQTGPVTKATKNICALVGINGVDVGTIGLLIRVTCLGKQKPVTANPCTDLGGIGDMTGGRGPNQGQRQSGGMYPGGDLPRPQFGYDPSAGFPGPNNCMPGEAPGMGGWMPGMGRGAPGMGGWMPGMGGGMSSSGMGFPGMGCMPGMGGGMPSNIDDILEPEGEYEEESDIESEKKKPPQDPDKDKDVLVLKIGNKNKVGKKPKLELVLKTPKLKFDELKTEERETQYLESDLKPPATGGKKAPAKKGAKGKGKK